MRGPLRLLLLGALLVPSSVPAHPGRTASDGCHYCRTRCGYWGQEWNERHCHGSTSKPVRSHSPPPKAAKKKKAKNAKKAQAKRRKSVTRGRTPEGQWARATVLVYAVVDGDTVKVKTDETPASRFKVRFRGIDCPEKDEAGAAAATEHVNRRLLGKTVVLQSGGARFERDRFGRTLAYVERLGVDVGRELIEKKLCVDYSHKYPHPRQDRYLRSQAKVR